MTKEEALKILRSEILEPYTGEYSSELKCIAIRMGIEALEQEPCEDCISRKEVKKFVEYIQAIKDNHNEKGSPINYGTICDIVINAHKLLDLPPVTPTKCIAAVHFSKEDLQEIVDEKVKELVTSTQEWIPCSERLPDEDISVLITYKYSGSRIVTTAYKTSNGWKFDNEGWIPNEVVIAWQPLPKPYEGDGKE